MRRAREREAIRALQTPSKGSTPRNAPKRPERAVIQPDNASQRAYRTGLEIADLIGLAGSIQQKGTR